MNPFAAFLSAIGGLVQRAFKAAQDNGLTDEILKQALAWARVAATQFVDNDVRRAFVVKMLVSRGVPESIARIAVEAAVQLLKQEAANADV